MSVRLRQQSSAWLAPTALAAQLKARAGELEGQGMAGLLGGVATGLKSYTANQQRREEINIAEQHHQDALARQDRYHQDALAREDRAFSMQDRAFKYGVVKDQAAALDEMLKGKMLALDLANTTGKPDPKLVQDLQALISSRRRMAAEMGDIGGFDNTMPQLTSDDAASFVNADVANIASTDRLSPNVLENLPLARLSEVVAHAKAQSDVYSALLGRHKNPPPEAQSQVSKLQSILGTYNENFYVASSILSRREKEEQTKIQAAKEKEVAGSKKEASAASDLASIASLQEDLVRRGFKEILPKDLVTARLVYRDLVVTDPNSEAAANRKAAAAAIRAENQKSLVEARYTKMKEFEDYVNGIKEPAERAKATKAAIDHQESLVKQRLSEYEMLKKLQGKQLVGEDDPDLVGGPGKPSAWERYEAERDTLVDMIRKAQGGSPVQAPTGAPEAATPSAQDAAAPVATNAVEPGVYIAGLQGEAKEKWFSMSVADRKRAMQILREKGVVR